MKRGQQEVRSLESTKVTTGKEPLLAPRTTYEVEIPSLGTYRVATGPGRPTITSVVAAAIVALTGKVAYIPVWNEIRLEGKKIIVNPPVRLSAPRLP